MEPQQDAQIGAWLRQVIMCRWAGQVGDGSGGTGRTLTRHVRSRAPCLARSCQA